MRKYDNLTKFQTNINFIKECLIISLRKIVEYKVQFYSGVISSISFLFISIFSLLVFRENFGFLNLNLNVILFFVLFYQLIISIFLIFYRGSKSSLFILLVRGDINNYLTKPIVVLVQFIFKNIKIRWLINSIFYFIVILIFLYFQDLSFSKFFLIFFLSLIICYFFIVSMLFVDSLSFYCNMTPFLNFFMEANLGMGRFPPIFFDKFEYKNFLFLLPLSLVVFPTLYYFDLIGSNYLFWILIICLILSIILTFLTLVVWKKGLKRYEAFG